MKRIYVSGPYSQGTLTLNLRNAIEAGEVILGLGAVPYVPHLTCCWDLISPHTYEEWLEYDMKWIDVCDAVFRLPGESRGADMECAYAESQGKPVFHDVCELAEWLQCAQDATRLSELNM